MADGVAAIPVGVGVGVSAPADRSARALGRAWRRMLPLLGAATAVALLMSTEFLFQPFVWRNFGFEEIVAGWAVVARNRLVVALTIAAALAPAGRTELAGPLRFLPGVLAVVAGAAVGEGLLSALHLGADRADAVSTATRIVRWSLVGGAVAVMVSLWRTGAELAAAGETLRVQASDSRRLAASSRLEMLRRQIEPHFLFNTLATVRRLHETEPAEGQRLLGRLLQVMSATLGEDADRPSTLGQEVALVGAYLDVCAARMSGQLRVHVETPAALAGLPFPPLVLATLAENAVKHGLFPNNGGTVRVSAERRGDTVEVVLADDGVGLSGEGGGGLGLANVAERLRLLYGPRAELRLQPAAPTGVRASIRIPAVVGAA